MRHMVSPPFQSTITAGWTKPCQTNWLLPHCWRYCHLWQWPGTLTMLGTFCNGVLKGKSRWTTPDKWQFAQSEVNFARITLSAEAYCVDKSITVAISNFPTPANWTDLHAFFGLVNQLSASTSIVTGLLAPLRPLLSTKNEFTWPLELNQAFTTAKQSLTSAPTLSLFDHGSPHTCVPMPVDNASNLCRNWNLETHGPLFRQNPHFSLTQNLATL